MTINRDFVETPTSADTIHAIGSLAVSLVPGASELFNFLFTSPAMKRRDDWIESLEQRIIFLTNNQGVSIESLKNNEEFISAVFYASSLSLKTHLEEKRKILLNAVTNIAQNNDMHEAKQQIFFNYINEFSVLHIKLLKFFNNPEENILKENIHIDDMYFSSSLIEILLQCHLAHQNEEPLIIPLVDSLYSYGLINIEPQSLKTQMTSSGLVASRTTPLGKDFLKFISDPTGA